jgi:hypothetical protein
MYKRDVGVLLLAVWAVFVSLRTEGPIGFSKSFYLRFPRADSSRHDRRFMPRPHSVDLNGDGKPEFVTTTPGGEQLILAAPRKGGDGFQEALVLARVDVGSLSGAEGSRVISLAHGSLDPPMNDFVHAPRRHVVAALCSDGQLLLLDSNLKLRWKSSIPGALSDESSGGVYTLKDISLAITPHGVNDREHGMVVAMMSKATAGQEEGDDYEDDDYEEEEKEEKRHERGREKNESLEEIDNTGSVHSVKHLRHVSYYAFAGDTGNLVWTHRPEDFHKDPRDLVEHSMSTLYTDRLITELESGVHYGEKSCKEYRESVLASLPHAWYHEEDSFMRLAHFHRHRTHHGNQRHNLQRSEDDAIVAWQHRQRKRDAIRPNVIVSHTEDAMEVIHVFSGRPVCRIPLEKNVLHADVNGDGVFDHVHVSGGTPREGASHALGHEKSGPCMARVTSGIPASIGLFNGTVCSSSSIRAGGPIDVARPVVLSVPGTRGHFASTLRQKSRVFFFNSRGEVSAFDHAGEKLFVEHTGIEFDDTPTTVPTFEAFSFRRHAQPSAVLAAGSHGMTIVSEQGREIWSGELPQKAVQKLVVDDLNFDGLNDIVLVSEEGLYGWLQVRSPGAGSLSALAAGMLVVMFVIVVSFFSPSSSMASSSMAVATMTVRKRSTDRID